MYQMFYYSTSTVLKHILCNQPMGCPYNICMQLPEYVIIKAVTPHGRKIHIQVMCFGLLTVQKGKVLQSRGCDDLMNVYASWVHAMNVRT